MIAPIFVLLRRARDYTDGGDIWVYWEIFGRRKEAEDARKAAVSDWEEDEFKIQETVVDFGRVLKEKVTQLSVSREESREKWELIVGEFHKSGKNMKAFAIERGVGYQSLRTWIARFENIPINPDLVLTGEVKTNTISQ